MKTLLFFCMVLCGTFSYAQHILYVSVRNSADKSPLAGATVTIASLNRTSIADSTGGIVFRDVPEGRYLLRASFAGFKPAELSISVPYTAAATAAILLEIAEEEEEEVFISTTRSSRTISDIPTRVETISGEELTEKGNMKPGDIRMLLNESTGIQTQQTSATSYNSSIRIQGLDGRYTQVLRDGFPLYAGFSGGLSLMQVAPLDLQQIEVIKGSSSTLYGGGAIAGLVNLVSKTPTDARVINIMGNATSAGGLDLSGFYSQRFHKIGISFFGSRNTGKPYDPAGIGLTAIPKFERYTFHPRLFFYGTKTTANIGASYITEDRTGGSMDYIRHGATGFFEANTTDRITTQAQIVHRFNDKSQLNFKNSYTRFNRRIAIPSYAFEGLQQATFSELTYSNNGIKADWIIGANVITDNFKETLQSSNALRDYHYNTLGIFLQNTWRLSPELLLETGFRGDHTKQFGLELLPRIAMMYKMSPAFTTRLGGGLGYKTPSVFNEASEKLQFQRILPINEGITRNERSAGGSFDINYRTKLGELGLTLNHLFFFTRLNRPPVLTTNANGSQYVNASGYINTQGMETNLRISYADLKLFVGYTYADANTHFNDQKTWFLLTARHRLNNVLMYEKEEKLKIGIEAYYFSKQLLSDGTSGRAYWTFGLMGEKMWEGYSLFINFENFTDTRQTKFESIFSGSINAPVFRDIYAPVDGFVVNGGIKISL